MPARKGHQIGTLVTLGSDEESDGARGRDDTRTREVAAPVDVEPFARDDSRSVCLRDPQTCIIADAYGGVHESPADAPGTLAPKEIRRLRAAQRKAQQRAAAERKRQVAWWREHGAPGDPGRLARIDA